MTLPLSGVRIIELASWTFVPAAAAYLADLGAGVIKVEPAGGDPQRGLLNLLNTGITGPNPFLEIPNRNKRSITLDLRRAEGRKVLYELVARADVFLTSYLPTVRQRLGVDVDDLRSVNEMLIYVRGSGWGPRGPMSNVGGYDLAAGWASSGLASRLTPEGGVPEMQPSAFFDLQGANAIAGAIGTALFHRERSGNATVVDVSLLGVGWWTMAPDIVVAPYTDSVSPKSDRTDPGNPMVNSYQAADGRWLYLVCMQSDRFWAELCQLLDREDLIIDERFVDASARAAHRRECVLELDAAFATQPLDEWQKCLEHFSGVWAPIISALEVHAHPQALPKDYLPEYADADGSSFRLPAPPVQFDGGSGVSRSATPEVGQHTEDILLEVGYSWDVISELRQVGVFG